jgi:hypothetical protein
LIYYPKIAGEMYMDKTKYGKYIITEPKSEKFYADYEPKYNPGQFLEILTLDDEVVKGAFNVTTNWFFPIRDLTGSGDGTDTGQVKPHEHDFDEVLAMFGSNPENSHDLGAECEFWLGNEKHTITKSCIIFIPRGLRHGPIGFTRIDRPVIQFGIRVRKNEEIK